MTSRSKPAAARLAACALTVALGTGLAGPAFATADPRPSPPPGTSEKPPAQPDATDQGYYCRADPYWYMCQHHHR